jgi:hypothetical protein
MKILKLLLVAAGASVLLGTLVSSASARNLSFSNQSIRASFREVIYNGPFGNISCQLTMEGSLHSRTMAKVSGSLIGYITRVRIGPCTTGTATILMETVPWHMRYHGFSGTLPNITSIHTHIVGAAWRVREPGGVTCLARSTAAEPLHATFHRNIVTHQLAEVGLSGRIRTGAECFGTTGEMASDSARVYLLGSSHTLVFVSLI